MATARRDVAGIPPLPPMLQRPEGAEAAIAELLERLTLLAACFSSAPPDWLAPRSERGQELTEIG